MAGAIASLACCAVLVSACGLVGEETVAWDNGEHRFEYPASWTLWGPDEPIVMRRPEVLAYLGTVPVDLDDICYVGRVSAGCEFDAYPMQPGGVTVAVIRWQVPGEGPGDEGEHVEVGGHEARYTEEATDRDSVMLRWTIDDPHSSYLTIWAEIQGPGEGRLRGQLEALIASFEFIAPGVHPSGAS